MFTWLLNHILITLILVVATLVYVGAMPLPTADLQYAAQTARRAIAGDQSIDPRGATERMLQRHHQGLMDAAGTPDEPVQMQGYYGALDAAASAP